MRDAEPAQFPPARLPRIEPRSPLVWIRIGGAWRAGRITKWVKDGERWLVWASYQAERPYTSHAWLLYDPEAIRPREEGGAPPSG